MKGDLLSYLKDLNTLGKASRNEVEIDTDKLAQDFLHFSALSEGRALAIRRPKMYALRGDEKTHFQDALDHLEVKVEKPVEAVDISGGFDHSHDEDAMVFLSPQQIRADHYSQSRSFLNPLIEVVYSNGAALLRDFALHEALCGRAHYKRGDLDLREIGLFPEKFSTGPYDLRVILDTPNGTVKKFKKLVDTLGEFSNKPKAALLHPEMADDATRRAIELRTKLGSLSRYEPPTTTTFAATTNSCVVRNAHSTQFYLYAPSQGQNFLVTFGKSPFANPQDAPLALKVLDGNDSARTLVELVEAGILKPSKEVLAQRLKDFERLYEEASRASESSLNRNHSAYKALLDGLAKAQKEMPGNGSTFLATKYLKTQPSALVEFMVCPTTEDPVLYDLLPRLSWNRSLRRYADKNAFIGAYEVANPEQRKEILSELQSSVLFSHQQNPDVNYWLYQHHRDECLQAGLTFSE